MDLHNNMKKKYEKPDITVIAVDDLMAFGDGLSKDGTNDSFAPRMDFDDDEDDFDWDAVKRLHQEDQEDDDEDSPTRPFSELHF